jgi:hypothetical protein
MRKDLSKLIRDWLYQNNIYQPVRKAIMAVKKPYNRYRVKKSIRPVLCLLNEIFEKHSDRYWLDFGTLLGFVREGKIIQGDDDLDFGVIWTHGTELRELLKKEDVYINKRLVVNGEIAFEKYNYRGFLFDVFYYRVIDDAFVTYLWIPNNYAQPQIVAYQENNAVLRKTTFSRFKTDPIHFYGCPFSAPDNTEKYLTENYGENYMIPDPNFSYYDERNTVTVIEEHEMIFYNKNGTVEKE